ncbi:MAG: enoyl-CoA hydratase [Acetobacteraceae bacterium]|nr:enoyl-CoA hydratase [Acetobacteraceae bacterium]
MTPDHDPFLLSEVRDGILTVTLNRPASRNALSQAMLSALEDMLESVAADPAIRVLVLRGAGPGFCAGHDLREIRAFDGPARARLFAQCSRMMQRLTTLPVPVIAQVHGIATAAGCQLVATCDLAIAADTARFAVSGINVGLFCSTPMVALSRVVPRKAAMEMLLTGDMLPAPEAARLGLVNRCVPDAELAEAVQALARKIGSKSRSAVALGKPAFYRQAELPLAEAYAHTAEVMVRNMEAHDANEGIDAFIGKRAPVWAD